ncbi:hypothetical protein DL96DRAFT_518577 [Flagelloscypha sp. PMI_526]|nr:hypothetical protein DL96DRAFT_518577 [Flagelloscypha sp. PMI_526]
MSQSGARIVAIVGATGAQGGSVLDSVLADKTFTPRAITRDVNSDQAKALAKRGIDLVKADLGDIKSIENAVDGCEVVFGMTNAWDFEIMENHELEVLQGRNLVDACIRKNVQLLVWSSQPSYFKESGGKYTVRHCDNKNKTDEYLRSQTALKYTILHTVWFPNNLWRIEYLRPNPDKPGAFHLAIPVFDPSKKQVVTHAEREIGPSALVVMKKYDDPMEKTNVIGKTLRVAGVYTKFQDMAKAISKVSGKEVEYVREETAGLDELDQMYKFQSDGLPFKGQEFPDPWLVKQGVKFATLNEIAEDAVALSPHFQSANLRAKM